MLGTASPWFGSSLVVFKVVFLVVGLPSIVSSCLGFQDMGFGDMTFIARGRLHDLMIFFVYPSIYVPSSPFIAACVCVTFPFVMFATPGLDSVIFRVCSVDLEDCFWSQVWALVSLGLAYVLLHSGCSFLPLLPLNFVVLHRHRRLVCACLVC
ncbi:LOW QUALITY PROTEIN: hypothetical protein HID58_062274, partial [Brassica napus]